MNKNPDAHLIDRRRFIKSSLMLAGASVIIPGSVRAMAPIVEAGSNPGGPRVKLSNGVLMPLLGFGTLSLNNNVAVKSVAHALNTGYRHIDTATLYKNEEFVGQGIKQSGIDRKNLFITSKVWVADSGYDKAKAAFQLSLDKLETDYLDLYLIHRPRGDVKGSWMAMEELHKAGRIRAIGISNFLPSQMRDLNAYATVKPCVNQIETHAFWHQKEAYQMLEAENVQLEAWAPFAQGKNGMFSNETIAAIGKNHKKTNAQVCLRWHYQRGIVAIPRSSQEAHIEENFNILDFELSEKEMLTMATLDLNTTQFPTWK